jgi:hypothetical protein
MATIQIHESVLARLTAQAARQGVSLEAYLEQLADLQSPKNNHLPRLSGEELERLLEAEASSDSTYLGTYPRADIYLEHD